eukprot:4866990-Pyramimonas_sp.AAC.1
MSAVILTLLERGWHPETPTKWHLSEEIAWDFPEAVYHEQPALNNVKAFSDDFDQSAAAQHWQHESRHFCGSGLQGGVDNVSLGWLLKYLEALPRGRRLAE